MIHSTAEVSKDAEIGEGTTVWHQAQVREGARIGTNCTLSKGVYIDTGVVIGNNVKIQNYVSVYSGVTIEDGVLCGPHCVFTNDKRPRAINLGGSLKSTRDWSIVPTLVKTGASIGANAAVLCGITIGRWAMIGAGSVVCKDVPDYSLAWGNPAVFHGLVCPCGHRLRAADRWTTEKMTFRCSVCLAVIRVPSLIWEQVL